MCPKPKSMHFPIISMNFVLQILSFMERNLNSKFSFSFEVSTQENCLFLNILYDNLLKIATNEAAGAEEGATDWTF